MTAARALALPGAHPGLGVLAIVGSAACFAALDSTTRWLGAFLPVLLMLWMRYAVHALVMAAWLALDAGLSFRTRHPRFQVLRGLLLLTSSTLAFHGLQAMPVAEFTAIVMLTPLLVTLLAAIVLHEHVSRLRWLLVAGGFLGALVVIRPGSGLFGWAVLYPLAASFSNASFQVLSSRLAAHESPHTTNFYTGLTGVAVLTPLLLASPLDADGLLRAAGTLQLAMLVMLGLFGTAGHLLLVMALGLARTASLMPFLYTQIAFAAVIGLVVFGTTPDAWGWLGMAIIAVCGAASAWLNIRDATQRRPVSAVELDTVAD